MLVQLCDLHITAVPISANPSTDQAASFCVVLKTSAKNMLLWGSPIRPVRNTQEDDVSHIMHQNTLTKPTSCAEYKGATEKRQAAAADNTGTGVPQLRSMQRRPQLSSLCNQVYTVTAPLRSP